ncbi:hypothetical protein D9757_010991 [Collybiopsis confluens]|uniref:non-specific serine/threonine protein kinase n=1 Tax=Collybiopsis confluens TaxID=2823264 RepID=A0A8H5GMV9_9AGAR|nr:hypothetical protein D9757_010991 [Collybiopsis confluens]
MIIRSFLPSHRSDRKHNAPGTSQPPNAPLSLSSASSNSSTYSSNASAAPSLSTTPASAPSAPVPVTLRLNRPLGQGTFSSVWLAEDLSPISLLLRSRKSLKDMKRKSTKDLRAKRLSSKAGEKGTERRDGKLKSISSLTSTSSLMRRLRGGVSGTRPGGTSASSAGPSAENQPSSAIVSMGRHGTLMPSPFLPPESVPAVPGLPPSLIPGNRTSSSSPSAVSSRTLGLALPAHPHYHSNEEHQRVSSASSAQSVFLEFTDHHLGSGYRSPPPISPNFFPGSDSVPVLTLGVHNNSGGQGASVSRASSLSLKSSESSDEGGSGSSGAGVLRTGSTRSTFSTRSAQDVNTFSPNQDESVSRTSSTRSSVQRSRWSKLSTRLVAVKLTSRGVIEEREKVAGKVLSRVEKMEDEERERRRERERDRTRVSFVREVEVLKFRLLHRDPRLGFCTCCSLTLERSLPLFRFFPFEHISHPNITPLLSHLTTRTHHLLVLPYLPGGDLLGLVNDEDTWNHLGESTLRRIFAELCKAVGWMHGVGLVHRDIKLENILLTVPLSPASALLADGSVSVPGSAFTAGGGGIVLTDGSTTTSSPTSYSFASSGSMPDSPTSFAFGKNTNMPAVLPTPPHPLVKLTDFGLSRFIDPASPLLTTRCGSEAYAAPELVVGGGRAGVANSSIRSPWFEEDREAGYNVDGYGSTGGYDARETDAWACGVVLYALVARKLPFGEGPGESLGGGRISGEGGGGAPFSPQERKQWLMKIARGEWEWPVYGDDELLPSSPSASADADAGRELGGCKLVCSAGAKRVVQKLLVRDPNRRKRIKDLWDDEWVAGGLNSGSTLDACAVEGLPSGSDAILDASRPQELDYLSPGLPEYSPMSFVPTFSRMGTMPVFPAEFGAESIAKTSSSGSSYDDSANGDEDLFDNDRRENGEDTGSQTADEEEELEDEEEDGEGWLVDKDGINNIARSEVPR